MQMKAAVLHELGQPFTIEDVPMPLVGPDEVLVQTRTCGICRTDLHIQDGLAYVPALPHIPGHEPAGVVAEVGKEVTGVTVGQRVVPHLFVARAECRYTRAGQHAQATHLQGILGVTLAGGFAEYFKVPARNLLVLPPEVPFDAGGLASCAVITAVHAFRKAALQMGDTAVVQGAGGIGLILVQLLKAAGVRVVAVDSNEAGRQQALRAGAELALGPNPKSEIRNPKQIQMTKQEKYPGSDLENSDLDIVSDFGFRILDFSSGGVDAVFELVGRAATMQAAAGYVRRCGQIIVIGEEPEFPAIDTIHIAQKELRIYGSRNGGMQDAQDALELMARGVIRPVIAARFPLERFNEGLAHVRRGEAPGRVVVTIKD
jgi:propanol-preferring alcohol dehydrogenase